MMMRIIKNSAPSHKANKLVTVSSGVIVLAGIILSGCSSGFSPGSQSGPSQSASNAPAGNTGPVIPADPWQGANMNGKVGGGRFGDMPVLRIDKVAKEIVVSLPMPANPYIDGIGLQVPIEQLPGARAGIEPISGGGSALVLRVPLHYLIKGVDFLPANRLPNGDPLPAIPDGELPSLAIQLNNIKNIKATVYLSVQTIAVFVNTPFDPLIYLQLPIKSELGTRTWGYLTTIPAKKAPQTPADGGFFLGIQIPDDLARIIDDNL